MLKLGIEFINGVSFQVENYNVHDSMSTSIIYNGEFIEDNYYDFSVVMAFINEEKLFNFTVTETNLVKLIEKMKQIRSENNNVWELLEGRLKYIEFPLSDDSSFSIVESFHCQHGVPHLVFEFNTSKQYYSKFIVNKDVLEDFIKFLELVGEEIEERRKTGEVMKFLDKEVIDKLHRKGKELFK